MKPTDTFCPPPLVQVQDIIAGVERQQQRAARSQDALHLAQDRDDVGTRDVDDRVKGGDAALRPVLDAQQELRARMERQPVRFLVRDLEPLLDAAREELASFLHADPARLVFVGNATSAVNAVLRSLPLKPSDELLTTDHDYNACRCVLQDTADRARARLVVAPPIRSGN